LKKLRFLSLLLSLLLLAGCADVAVAAQQDTETITTLPVVIAAEPRLPTEVRLFFWDGQMQETVATLDELTPQSLGNLLGLSVNSLVREDDDLVLDLSQWNGTDAMQLAALADTFLKAYAAQSLTVTVNGAALAAVPLTFNDGKTVPATSAENAGSSLKVTKQIAFTFDDGPHNTLTRMFVDKLKEYGGVATFFEVGNRMKGDAAEGVRYAAESGCEIAIHGYTHEYNYKTCSEENYQKELEKTRQAIVEVTGTEPTLMRPIGGNISKERVAASVYPVIIWNVDSNDWRYKSKTNASANVKTIVNNVLDSTGPGAIILMHEIYQNSFDAFSIIIDELARQGYRFVTVSQLLAGQLEPGKLYYSAK